jgi:hypothetical protein
VVNVVQDSRDRVSLLEEAQSGFYSLVQQTATVFIGFLVMLLIAGGAPSGFVIALSVGLGTCFVAWREHQRLKLKSPISSSAPTVGIDERFVSSRIVQVSAYLKVETSPTELERIKAELILLEQKVKLNEATIRELREKYLSELGKHLNESQKNVLSIDASEDTPNPNG